METFISFHINLDNKKSAGSPLNSYKDLEVSAMSYPGKREIKSLH